MKEAPNGALSQAETATMRASIFVLYMLAAATIWCGVVGLYAPLFAWSEWVKGINLVYLPHGVRLVVVILFGLPGAVGIGLGTAAMGWQEMQANPLLWLTQSVIAGGAPWLALWIAVRLRWGGDLERRLGRLESGFASYDGHSLLALALMSAVLNSGGHVLAWLGLDPQADRFDTRFATMFVGDLFGAMLVLYGLRLLFVRLTRDG